MSIATNLQKFRYKIFRFIFKEEINELSEGLRLVKKIRENNVRHRNMVQSLFNASTPNALRSIKKRRGPEYNNFIDECKKEIETPTLDELIGKDEH